MFSHIVVGANDVPAAKRFYDGVMGALGHPPGTEMGDRVVYRADGGTLMVTKPIDGNPACHGNGMTIGLVAPSPEAVDAFHAAGLAEGGTDAGPPGPRPAMPGSYGCYVRDPTGNKLVAWFRKAG